MNVALLEYVYFTIHVQENNPRLSLVSELDRRGPGIARHLIVVPFAADGFARFGLASHFIGFEVNDKPARVGSIEQVNDAAFIWEIVADFMVALGGVEFSEEQVGAQAFEQLAGISWMAAWISLGSVSPASRAMGWRKDSNSLLGKCQRRRASWTRRPTNQAGARRVLVLETTRQTR